MEITVTRLKRGSLLTIEGRLDHTTVSQFSEALDTELDDGVKKIAIDMADVEYLNSASIRAMVGALKDVNKRGGTICLAAPSERVREVLNIAGLLGVFDVYEDATTAVGSF